MLQFYILETPRWYQILELDLALLRARVPVDAEEQPDRVLLVPAQHAPVGPGLVGSRAGAPVRLGAPRGGDVSGPRRVVGDDPRVRPRGLHD